MISDTSIPASARAGFFNTVARLFRYFLHSHQKLPRLPASVHPLRLPLPADPATDWKLDPLFHGQTPVQPTFTTHLSTLTPGQRPHPPERHLEEQIIIVLHGRAELELPDLADNSTAHLSLGVGEGVYYPPFFSHSIRGAGTESVHYLVFKWSGSAPLNPSPSRLPFTRFGQPNIPSDALSPFHASLQFEGPSGHLGKLHCHHTTLAPGAGYEPHTDRYDVALILLRGTVRTLERDLIPYDLAFFPAGTAHGMFNPSSSPAEYLVLEFHGRRSSFIRRILSPFFP
jgi:mannose-6-phosphate isomerase-like protein (cupin superfamily)